MKILFSPSEGKHSGGDAKSISSDTFIFPELYPKRRHILELYNDYIHTCEDESLKKLIGVKKDEEAAKIHAIDLFSDPTMKAIERYSGVAYDYLDYPTLDTDEKKFIDENLLIFSNLFGPILAKDRIPYYKLKQGEKLGDFAIEKFYAQQFTSALNDYLHKAFVIDLRAGFYLKFYKLSQPHVTMKFIKNGKVVSHWAKAYRGMVVRELAKYRSQNEKMFSEIPFRNLSIVEIQKTRLKTEYIYEITA